MQFWQGFGAVVKKVKFWKKNKKSGLFYSFVDFCCFALRLSHTHKTNPETKSIDEITSAWVG